jgi:hypothetical protein
MNRSLKVSSLEPPRPVGAQSPLRPESRLYAPTSEANPRERGPSRRFSPLIERSKGPGGL